MPHLGFIHLEDVLAFEDDLAAYGSAWRIGDQTHNRKRAHALAAAALSYNAQHLAFFQVVANAIHRFDDAILGEEVGCEIPDFK